MKPLFVIKGHAPRMGTPVYWGGGKVFVETLDEAARFTKVSLASEHVRLLQNSPDMSRDIFNLRIERVDSQDEPLK